MKTWSLGAHSGSFNKTLVARTRNLGASGDRAPVRQQPWHHCPNLQQPIRRCWSSKWDVLSEYQAKITVVLLAIVFLKKVPIYRELILTLVTTRKCANHITTEEMFFTVDSWCRTRPCWSSKWYVLFEYQTQITVVLLSIFFLKKMSIE